MAGMTIYGVFNPAAITCLLLLYMCFPLTLFDKQPEENIPVALNDTTPTAAVMIPQWILIIKVTHTVHFAALSALSIMDGHKNTDTHRSDFVKT